MFEYFYSLYAQFSIYAKANPVIAGAVSLWALSTVTFLLRGIPAAVYFFLTNQLTTTLRFSNAGWGYSTENFASFLVWFEKHKWSKYARSISMDVNHSVQENKSMVTGIGDGYSFFVYKRRLFFLHRYTETKAGSDKLIHLIKLTMIGRNKQVIYDMIEEFSFKLPGNAIGIYKFHPTRDEWINYDHAVKRPLRTVVVNKEIKNSIIYDIEQFKISRDWYYERGLAYKQTFALHGIPGTGKTSLIKAIACHFGMKICVINICAMTDALLEDALRSVPDNSIIVIEDFDSAEATKKRKELRNSTLSEVGEGEETISVELPSDFRQLTLTGILNALDGIISLDNKILFLTTNVFESLDDAVVRKGRVDHVYELKALTHCEVIEYIALMFPDAEVPDGIVFDDIVGCNLQDLYFNNKHNAAGFISAIPKKREL